MLSLSATLLAIKNQIQNKPVEIHDIYLGSQTAEDSNTLHFVGFYRSISFFQPLSHAAQVYTSLYIQRSVTKRTSRNEIERISYQVDNVNQAMTDYAADHDFRNKRIITRLIFRDNLSSYLDAKLVFDGFIQAISFPKGKMEATCTPRIGTLSFETGWPYQIQCNAKFGDAYCKIDKTSVPDNTKTGSVTSATISTVADTVNLTQPDDYWNWGTITFTSGENTGNSRKIFDFDNATATLTLDYAFDTAPEVGDTFSVSRGCDKTLSSCNTKFGNTDNYHGFHTIPLRL